LFDIWRQVSDDSLEVAFDFSRCGFLRQNAVAFLGGLAQLIEQRAGIVTFLWDSLPDYILGNLQQNGFCATFGYGHGPWSGNSIPYREDHQLNKEGIADYLKKQWLGRGWVNISPSLRDAIVGRVWEIYVNAFEHAQSNIGVYSCGQHYPSLKLIKLTVVDYGVGIPANVRVFKRDPRISAAKALQWAFIPGTTTQPKGTSRGMGLDLLKEFVRVNKGLLEVFSHEGWGRINEHGEFFETRTGYFEGTLVNITLKCDEFFYCLATEPEEKPLF